MTRIKFMGLVMGALLGACGAGQNGGEQTTEGTALSTPATIAPAGKLSNAARPLSYDVAMKVDPREESFRGIVTIEVWLNEAADELWLHGDDLRVQAVSVEGEDATYEEVLPTGVSRIGFAKTILLARLP